METNVINNHLKINIRKINRDNSPNKMGSSDNDALPYLHELGIKLETKEIPMQFLDNRTEFIHRWAPYVQGFSASFVQSQFDLYKSMYPEPVILDPFSGCGTVLVQSKINGYKSFGTELNPLLQFVANVKLSTWDVSPGKLVWTYENLRKNIQAQAPEFLESETHFNKGVLHNLLTIKGGIDALPIFTEEDKKIRDLLLLAFSSILIDCSNLVRGPCLGYSKTKKVNDDAPFELMIKKVMNIASDLRIIQTNFIRRINVESRVILSNAKDYEHEYNFDLVITSPPYMNGLDYVINYKIEMAWLGFAENQKQLKKIKDEMVVCDNVSKGLVKDFSISQKTYTNEWIENIKTDIARNIEIRGSYRRMDMPLITHKYFDDMYQVIENVAKSMKSGGRFILVVGDSLIADVYIPTDLLIAKIGKDLGLEIERVEKARSRRSGQIRSYKLRESIITLRKS